MIKLISITIKNFRGFAEERHFDFGGNKLVLLTAPNGNGKTSLIDAIEWCLTGDIKRLHEAFNRRNTNNQEKKSNEGAILKNAKHPELPVEVALCFDKDGERHTVRRVQEEDSLNNSGNVQVDGNEGEQAQSILNDMLDGRNFYKYHFCDMQKTYNFLGKSRSQLEEEFSDFSSDYSDAENVVQNLQIYQEDIKTCIEAVKKNVIPEDMIKVYEETKKRLENSAENLPYEKSKLFSSEEVEIEKMSEEELKAQLEQLYAGGYARAEQLLEKKKAGADAEKQYLLLTKLQQELKQHGETISEAIDQNVYKEEIRAEAENELQKYVKMELSVNNLEAHKAELIQMGKELFDEKYWNHSCEKLQGLEERQTALKNEINTLNKGDAVLDVLSSIIVGRDGLVQYRMEMKGKSSNQRILCPVCASEQFGIIEDEEITKQAQGYQAEHKELLEAKKREQGRLKSEEDAVWTERLKRAQQVLEEHILNVRQKAERLRRLYDESEEFFIEMGRLRQYSKEEYTLEKMKDMGKIVSIMNVKQLQMLSEEQKDSLDEEIKKIFAMVNYSVQDGVGEESVLSDIQQRAMKAPEEFMYDEGKLKQKISSIRSHINNQEYINTVNKLNEARKKNEETEGKINELNTLMSKARERAGAIDEEKALLKKEEYEQVGPYLYKILHKLARDVRIANIQLAFAKGDKAALLDENGKSLFNMFSDGQLSVFMLSYFFGNIFRMKEIEKFPIYFIDDITGGMDDINMLAFLDLIKFQLLDEQGAMSQVFFTTCDSRIQDMVKYKMDACGIQYSEIGTEKFAARA